MTNLIHLDVGQDPPKGESCLIVARDVTGGFYVTTSEAGYQRGASLAAYPISDADRTVVIDRAKAYGDQHGLHNVYVVT
ncbi:MAG TPA: hypothetical protein VN806_04165 [Caulobacteraceae bacterium]|nr:hypothetical protein [Caulobacteraceae bacterium]